MTDSGKIVVGIGEVLMDRFRAEDETAIRFEERFGGAPANFVYHASRCLGCEGVVVSAVGRDDRGRRIVGEIEARGLRFAGAEVPYESGVVEVTVENGKNHYTIVPGVAWDYLTFDNELEQLAAKTDAVCFGTLAQRMPVAAAAVRAFVGAMPAGSIRIFDANFRSPFYGKEVFEQSLRICNILKISDEEVVELCRPEFYGPGAAGVETLCRNLLAQFSNLEMIVVTCGAAGCRLFRREAPEAACPAAPIRRTGGTTVGAGDSFTGAFCAALLAGLEVGRALEFAAGIAAAVCGYREATPVYDSQMLGAIAEYGIWG